MSSDENGRPRDDHPGTGQEDAATTRAFVAIMTRPGDGVRARRIRRFYRRALDELTGSVSPWTFSEPIDWHATHMDVGLTERDQLGREFAEVGRG